MSDLPEPTAEPPADGTTAPPAGSPQPQVPETGPWTGRRRLVPVVLAASVLAIVVVAVVVASGRDSQGHVRVVEAGFSEVRRTHGLTGPEMPGNDGQPLVSWAAVIENTRQERTAHVTRLRVELLDDAGGVVDDVSVWVDILPPNRRTAVTGEIDERTDAVADIRVEVEETDYWRRADHAPAVEIDDLAVAYGPENQPLITFTATSPHETVDERAVSIVYRDSDGHIIGGSTIEIDRTDEPLEPGEPVADAVRTQIVVPGLATAEVYIEPTDRLSRYGEY